MEITALRENDFEKWASVWKLYLEFYHTSLPEEQYRKTFSRIIDQDKDLNALVARDEAGKILGLSHYFKTASAWSEKPHMLLQDLYCLESARGEGVGRALVDETARRAREAGCERSVCALLVSTRAYLKRHRLYWTTKADNKTARKLYDSTDATCEFVVYRMPLKQ